jgi:SusD family.
MKYIPFIASLLLLVSCKKFLDVDPIDAVSDGQTIVDKSSAETAVRGMYRSLAADGYYGLTFPAIGYLSGDNVQWTGSQSIVQQFITHNVRADNAYIGNAWSAIYVTINRANHILAKVPAVNDPLFAQDLRDQLTGEAYFVRALAYFDLARTWGGVQITLEPTESASGKNGIKRSTLAQTYAQVLSDLNAAEPLLPETTNRFRATKKTVWALKTRYYLYQQEWALAEEYATKVIDDAANYQLVQPYSAWFANNVVATPESVFELSYSATYTNGHRNQWQPPANGGTRQWAPADQLITQLNDAAVGGNRNAIIATTSAGLWYGNLYYRSPATDPAYVIRLAELYLARAEARAQQNKLTEAAADLDAVRSRAGLPGTTASDKGELLLAVEAERKLEFPFEPHRWFDLVRTGRAAAVLGVTNVDKYLLPIPAADVLIDPSLDQNTGY